MHRFFVRKKFQENLCLKVKLFILWILSVSKKGFWGYLNGGRVTKTKTSLLWQGGFRIQYYFLDTLLFRLSVIFSVSVFFFLSSSFMPVMPMI